MKYIHLFLFLLIVACATPNGKINYDKHHRIVSVITFNPHDSVIWVYDTLGFLEHKYYYESGISNNLTGVEFYLFDTKKGLIRLINKDFYGTIESKKRLSQVEIMDTNACNEDVIFKVDSINKRVIAVMRKKINDTYKITKIDSNANLPTDLYAKDWEGKIHTYKTTFMERIIAYFAPCK